MNCKSDEKTVFDVNNPKKCLTERKRRKLPELPIDKKRKKSSELIIEFIHSNNNCIYWSALDGLWQVVQNPSGIALSEELANPDFKFYSTPEKCLIRQVSTNMFLEIKTDYNEGKPVSIKLYNKDPTLPSNISPEDEDCSFRPGSDSGNSSAMSPTDESINCSNGMPLKKGTEKLKSLQLLSATHRGLYKFIPRHKDELEIEIGDPIYLSKENEDLWCEGINLRTGQKGIFPAALVTDVEYSEFVTEQNCDDILPNINFRVKRERYLLDFLGSVEVMQHKGNPVLCESVQRVICAKTSDIGMVTPHPSILEISELGLRMTDKNPVPTNSKAVIANHDYFFALKNVTFCGYYPEDHRYFGFITKHPTGSRLACHVFRGNDSTRDVAEAVGRAFHRFYTKFIELSYPIEEFYFD